MRMKSCAPLHKMFWAMPVSSHLSQNNVGVMFLKQPIRIIKELSARHCIKFSSSYCYLFIIIRNTFEKWKNTEVVFCKGKKKIKCINALKIEWIRQMLHNFLKARIYAEHKMNLTLPNIIKTKCCLITEFY